MMAAELKIVLGAKAEPVWVHVAGDVPAIAEEFLVDVMAVLDKARHQEGGKVHVPPGL